MTTIYLKFTCGFCCSKVPIKAEAARVFISYMGKWVGALHCLALFAVVVRRGLTPRDDSFVIYLSKEEDVPDDKERN